MKSLDLSALKNLRFKPGMSGVIHRIRRMRAKLGQKINKYLQNPVGDKLRCVIDFAGLKTISCPGEINLSTLRPIGAVDLPHIFNNGDVHIQWERAGLQLKKLLKIDQIPGDLRAIYYLIASLQPRSVLEVNTGTGVATATIALALKDYIPDALFVTTSLMDISESRIAQRLNAIGLENLSIVLASGTEFLDFTEDNFDLIFFNGDQSATTIYLSTHAGFSHLNTPGVMLYADYYPEGQPLYHDKRFMSGAFVALTRLCVENPGLATHPIGALPWPVKTVKGAGSTISALAILANPADK